MATKKIDYHNLNFDAFRDLAKDDSLSRHEKVGFPDDYREGKEEDIFADMRTKLAALEARGKTVIEVGPGCSGLPLMLAELCAQKGHELAFVDSAEMLDLLPEGPHIKKWAGRYPAIPGFAEKYAGKADVIIAYSVTQYVFAESNVWDFLDSLLGLLADGGEILLGDIPNATMRKRFFASKAGIKTHQEYTRSKDLPDVQFNCLERGQIDDSAALAILSRARAEGFHAWIVPQGAKLPMANRREDILIRKP